jgi:hypothetical protein
MLLSSIDLYLIPSPGAPEELMATIQPCINHDANPDVRAKMEMVWNEVIQNQSRKKKVTLEGYTRDGWAWKPNSDAWTTVNVVNIADNRKKGKLQQFVMYLKERQKSAYGRFGSVGVFVVSYVQSASKTSSNVEVVDQMNCRIATDCTAIPSCSLRPIQQPLMSSSPGALDISSASRAGDRSSNGGPIKSQSSSTAESSVNNTKRKGGGFLGKLVGAQQRTNEHVVASKQPPPSKRVLPQNSLVGANNTTKVFTSSTETFSNSILKSAQEVISNFRQECHDQMLNFDLSEEEVLHIPIVLKDYIQQVVDDERARISMDVLKYIVYEAAEEVNEEWVAYKVPSEFMDDITIAIYKEGAAPEHVLEDIQQAELPDEIRAQQRALQEQRTKFMQQAEMKQKQQLDQQIQVNEDDSEDDLEALNTKKRDRRTIEDYEREKREQQNPKRSRP